MGWQHVAPETQLTGEEGVLAALEQLEGFEAPAAEWERSLLPLRVKEYDPRWLDDLCLAGVVAWGRVSPHPAWLEKRSGESSAPRRVIPTSAAPITFYLREGAEWLAAALEAKCVEERVLQAALSPQAQQVRASLVARGAAFVADLQRLSGFTKLEVTTALWELATAGLASADGFDQLRAMMDPRRKSAAVSQTSAVSLRKRAAARTTAGRWSLFCAAGPEGPSGRERTEKAATTASSASTASTAAIAKARAQAAGLEAHARVLLCRYGVVFRDLLARESIAPKWRDLAPALRRMEERGEIRGGRFVSGPFGEQFALPEAVEGLRAARRQAAARANEGVVVVPAADPLNLVGWIVPGERVAAVPGREVRFQHGAAADNMHPDAESTKGATPRVALARPGKPARRSVAEIVRADILPARSAPLRNPAPSLFS